MLRKRLIGVLTIKDNLVVQSMGYQKYLPIGKPEYLVENLDRWGVDEILLLSIERTKLNQGPDISTLQRLSKLGIATPICYGGGLCTQEHAIAAIQAGADRIVIDQALFSAPKAVYAMSMRLGAQALIGALPVVIDKGIKSFDYLKRAYRQDMQQIHNYIEDGIISEFMLIDKEHEGLDGKFDEQIPDLMHQFNTAFILFGGISNSEQVERLLAKSNVCALGIGNSLNYKEHAVQTIKNTAKKQGVRPPFYHLQADYL